MLTFHRQRIAREDPWRMGVAKVEDWQVERQGAVQRCRKGAA
jgi:hypothetical protein